MKINKISCRYEYYEVDETTIEIRKKDYPVTEIREGTHEVVHCKPTSGYSIYSNDIQVGWIPYHAVTTIFFEVSDD